MSNHPSDNTKGRLLRRALAGLLTLALMLGLLPASVFTAHAASWADPYVQTLVDWGVMRGSNTGDLNPDRVLTRAEFVTMAVKASPAGDGVGQAASSPYPDVPRSHWASGYVEAAVSRGLVTAFSDGTFRPDQEIRLAEAASMVLTLLGYGPEDFSGVFPTGQLSMYHSLKLSAGVTAAGASSTLSRQDAVYLFYNLLLLELLQCAYVEMFRQSELLHLLL